MLIRLANEAFKKAGRPTTVETGRHTFPLQEGQENGDDDTDDNDDNDFYDEFSTFSD